MTLATIRADVRRKLNRGTFWSDADVDAAVNGVYLEACEVSKCYEAESALALLPDQTFYDLEDPLTPIRASSTTPYSVILELLRIWNSTTSRWLDIKTVREMDIYRPRWITMNGEPDTWIPRGYATFGVFPKIADNPTIVTSSGGSDSGVFDPGVFDAGIFDAVEGSTATETSTLTSYLLIRHTAVPVALEDDSDEPVIPVAFHQMLTDGAVAQLKGLEREPKSALRYFNSYSEMLADLESYVQQRNRRAQIPVVGSHPVGARR